KRKIDPEDAAIDGSFVLEVYGVRRSRDIDLIYHHEIRPQSVNLHISTRTATDYFHKHSPEQIIYDPKNYFLVNGLKFISINLLMKSKARRLEGKDIADLVRCIPVIRLHILKWTIDRCTSNLRLL